MRSASQGDRLPTRASRAGTWSGWGVHLLTAAGALCALFALIAVADSRWKIALVWMGVALVIDGVDGPLARRAEVRSRLPMIDGTLLDNLIDYLNYAVVPAFLLIRAELLPSGAALAGGGALCLAAAFQFSHREAKTADHFFRGFPSYWNLVAFYMLLLRLDAWVNLAMLLALCLLSFLPLLWVHPARTRFLRRTTLCALTLWGAALLALLAQFPRPDARLLAGSLLFVAYYVVLSLYLTARRRGKARAPVPS